MREEEYKTMAFADDMVMMLEDPGNSLKCLMSKIRDYGEVAGLRINWEKTKMITKNIKSEKVKKLEEATAIEAVNKVKYLGVTLTNKSSTIMRDNYLTILKEVQESLERWKKLHLSILGRIALIKMKILPKILFLFQTVPILLKQGFFTELNRMVMKFIWDSKRARIKIKLLQDHKSRAGMGLPDWKTYYQACALVWLKEWITLEDNRLLNLEGNDLLLGWHAFLIYEKSKTHSYFKTNIIRKALLQVWESLKHLIHERIPN